MANERLAQTYAQALFDQAIAHWLTPLKAIAASLARTDLTEQLDSTTVDFSRKQELARTLFSADTPPQVQNLVLLLASHNHVHLLPQIITLFEQYAQRITLGTRARIASAVPLLDAEKHALETKLRAQFGDDLVFDYTIDPALLGGVLIRVGDKVIDGTIAGKFAEMKEKLK